MNQLEQLRTSICMLDSEIIALIAKRQQLVKQVGIYKKNYALAVLDPNREALLRAFHAEKSEQNQLSPVLVAKIFDILIDESRKAQQNEQ